MSSKIKVDTIENVAGSGNVSLGSGHNLVVPGGITGQGTLAVTGTSTLTGNTAVGGTLTTTGATALNGGATVLGNTIMNPDTAGKNTFQFTSQAANDAKLVMKSDTTDKITIHANGTTILNGGAVTMPSVPRFLARRNQSSWSPSTNAIMVWDTATPGTYNGYNIGSHYSTSNGKFTCPVSGTYYFEATSIVNTIVTNGAWYLRKNGSAIHEQHITQTTNGWTAHHIAYTGEFAANDTMEVYNGSATIGYYGNAWSYFHGRMIG